MSVSERAQRTVFVFIPLAMNQADFYASVGVTLRESGYDVAMISLHEPSLSTIRAQGIPTFNFFEFVRPSTISRDDGLRLAKDRYGIENVNRIISHEKVFYEIRDSQYLVGKLLAFLAAMERVIDEIRHRCGNDLTIIQELGGFISVMAAYHVSRMLKLRHVFLEPSFFRGRMFLLRDTFDPPLIRADESGAVVPEMRRYLDDVVHRRQIVIPAKDAGHYRSVLGKIANRHNLMRLVQKAVQKYVRSQREEFTHLATQVRRLARMFRSDLLLRRYVSLLPEHQPYVYYPLHVWTDVALTIRAPEYLDQYWLLDYLARNVPASHTVAFKEHPAMVGGLDVRRVRDLLRRYDNLRLLPPWMNNYEIMRAADAVVTVNSKSGAEAVLLGKRVLTLGNSFYRSSGVVTTVSTPAAIAPALTHLLREPPVSRTRIEQFFQAVWDQSFAGELYLNESTNVRVFADSLIAFSGSTDQRARSPVS